MSKLIVQGDELFHYGVEGMKWGIRKYQNPDGTLTAEGRARYGYGLKGERTLRKEYKKAYNANARVYSDKRKKLKTSYKTGQIDKAKYKEEQKKNRVEYTLFQREQAEKASMALSQNKSMNKKIVLELIGGIGSFAASNIAGQALYATGYETAGQMLALIGGLASGALLSDAGNTYAITAGGRQLLEEKKYGKK